MAASPFGRTTTATVLAQAIIREGLKNVAAGANPMSIKKGILKAVDESVESLKKISKPIAGTTAIAQVAAISASDDEVGKLIAEAIARLQIRLFVGKGHSIAARHAAGYDRHFVHRIMVGQEVHGHGVPRLMEGDDLLLLGESFRFRPRRHIRHRVLHPRRGHGFAEKRLLTGGHLLLEELGLSQCLVEHRLQLGAMRAERVARAGGD